MPAESPDIAFSRTGTSCPLGKLDERVVVYVDEATFNLMLREANRLDTNASELVRDLIYLRYHGMTLLELAAKHRREQMQREGLDQGRGRAAS